MYFTSIDFGVESFTRRPAPLEFQAVKKGPLKSGENTLVEEQLRGEAANPSSLLTSRVCANRVGVAGDHGPQRFSLHLHAW